MVTTIVQNIKPRINAIKFDGQTITNGSIITKSGTLSADITYQNSLSSVRFYVDEQLFGNASITASGATLYWNINSISDAEHSLKIIVNDSVSNQVETTLAVTIAMSAPTLAPQISSALDTQTTNKDKAPVQLQAEPNSQIQLYRNALVFGQLITTDNNGQQSATVDLLVGDNQITAKAVNRGGSGPQSNTLQISYDDKIPLAPSGLIAKAAMEGLVKLSWQAVNDNTVTGYHIYRSETPFTQLQDAQKINNSLISISAFDDLPLQDATYYYRLNSENQLGTQSELSQQVSTTSDSTPPKAVQVEYLSDGLIDPDTGSMATGHITVNVHVSEALLTTPFFSLTPEHGAPKIIVLTKKGDILYQGQFDITSNTASGIAYAIFSARDVLGNRGTEIEQGSSISIDAAGPTIMALSIEPPAPVNNDPVVNVRVRLTLEEPIKQGTTAQLFYILSGQGREQVEIFNLTAIDDTHYEAEFELPADAGLNVVESLSFELVAVDKLDNPAQYIDVDNNFQIYQGDLPPVISRSNLDELFHPILNGINSMFRIILDIKVNLSFLIFQFSLHYR